jgi:hypothetical protein
MTDDLTPEQDAVRRLLAEARHDGPTPPEVVARLDEALADLVAERASTETAPPVVDLGARRRRRVGVGLLAAAAVVVGGVAVGQVLPSLQGPSDSTSAGSSADESSAREFGAAEESTDSSGGSGSGSGSGEERSADSELSSPQAKSEAPTPLAGAPTLSTADPDLADDLVALRDHAQRSGLAGPPAADDACHLRGVGRGRRVAVDVDGRAGVVVFRRPSGDLQEAVVYVCGDPEPVRAEVLPAP